MGIAQGAQSRCLGGVSVDAAAWAGSKANAPHNRIHLADSLSLHGCISIPSPAVRRSVVKAPV
jgi:hypothetical protein